MQQTQPSPGRAKLPKPTVTRAWLVSDGTPTPEYTPHHYYQTVSIAVDDFGHEYEFLFKCFKTGATRRWGTCFVEPPLLARPSTQSEPSAPSEGEPSAPSEGEPSDGTTEQPSEELPLEETN